MGMDAKVTIWVGLNFEDYRPDCLNDELIESLIESDSDYEIESIYCSDREVGLGITVYFQGWDYGVRAFDLGKLEAELNEASKALQGAFRAFEIDLDFDKIGVFICIGFS